MVVFEARVAAVCRIADGLVGGGVCFREEMLEKGIRDVVGWVLGLKAGLEVVGLHGWESAMAADLDVRAEGAVEETGFFIGGLLGGAFALERFAVFGFRSGYISSNFF